MNSNDQSQPSPKPSGARGPRWWPLLLLVAAVGARLVQVWVFRDHERQFKFASTWPVLRLAAPVALAWFVLFSRFRWRTRVAGLAILAAGAVLSVALLRVRGIDGDRVPVIEWRWNRHGAGAVAGTAPPSPTQDTTTHAPALRAAVPGAADYPQFQGPNRDAFLPSVALATNWSERPPEFLWRRPVGESWSGFAVAGGLALTMEQSGDSEVVVAMDLRDGARVWTNAHPARYENSQAGNGPRSTPTVVGNRVFATGATGILRCLDRDTGAVVWTVDLAKEHGARMPEWGYSASPLVIDGLVWVPAGAAGKSLVALDAATGRFRFGGGDSPVAYASPVMATLSGKAQILVLNDAALASHDPTDGHVLWERTIPEAPHVAAPVVVGTNRVAVSVGYGKGTFVIEAGPATDGTWTNGVVWKSIRLKSKFANLIPRGDTLYGLDDGALVALDLSNGALRWKETRYGHGQLIRAGDVLLVGAESGEAVLVDAGPAGMREMGRFRALADKTWNPGSVLIWH